MSAGLSLDSHLSAIASRLSPAPRVFQRLSTVIREPQVRIDEIVACVQIDATLAARILRLACSAGAGIPDPPASLAEAIERIGLYEVYRLVGAAMASDLYERKALPIYGLSGEEVWRNSVTTAAALESLCRRAGEDASTGYTLGLLRPVGRLLLQGLADEEEIRHGVARQPTAALVAAWEFNTFGTTSTEAVDRVFQLWGLPSSLSEPVRHHFAPSGDPSQHRTTALLHLACWIAAELGHGLAIEQHAWAPSASVLAQAGLSLEDAVRGVARTRSVADRIEEQLRSG